VEVVTAWIVLGVILLIAELFIPGFAIAMFGIACIFSGILAAVGVTFNGQLIAFGVTTAVMFVTVRPMVLKHLDARHVKTNVDALVGKTGVVTQRIDPAAHTGRVVVEGDDWRALSVEEVTVETGNRVQVVRVEGTKLFVKRSA
jgi:membrane protein implicated in regulation of membrane protease activity